ncbi:MAG: hypothetical protein QOI80_292 [Solirubrobacteraceae bacterium]|nr:hypothetical protein [Solirubrobacteraceae bacterium]
MSVRASDADRDGAANALRIHHAEGRIDDEEFEERLAVALSARTLADLEAVTVDLPGQPARAPAPQGSAVAVGGYGLREFRQRHELGCDAATAWKQVMVHIAPAMAAYGYEIREVHEPVFVVFELEEHPAWPWLLGGVLAIFASGESTRVVVSLQEETPSRTVLVAAGMARRPVRKAFAELSD